MSAVKVGAQLPRNLRNQHEKEKAVMQQKLEMMGQQVQEGQLREENLKRLNDEIMGMFSDLNNGKEKGDQFSQRMRQESEDHIVASKNNQEYLQQLEDDIRNLKELNQQLEYKGKQQELFAEKQVLEINQSNKDLAKQVAEQQEKMNNHKNEVLNLNLKNSQTVNQLQLQTD